MDYIELDNGMTARIVQHDIECVEVILYDCGERYCEWYEDTMRDALESVKNYQ